MTQLYISIALSLDQKSDQPRTATQKCIHRKANIQQTQPYVGHEQQIESVYGAGVYHRHKTSMMQLYIRLALNRRFNSKCITRLYNMFALSLDQRCDPPRAAKQKRIRCKANMQQRVANRKEYMTQLYISIALSRDRRGDQPRAAKRKRIRCKTNQPQTQLYPEG